MLSKSRLKNWAEPLLLFDNGTESTRAETVTIFGMNVDNNIIL